MASSIVLRDCAAKPSLPVGLATSATALPEMVARTRSSKELLRLKLYVSLVLVDAFGLTCALMLASSVRFHNPLHSQGLYLLAIMLPAYLGVALNGRAYALDVLQKPRVGIRRAAGALALSVGVICGCVFYLKVGAEISRFVLGAGSAASLVLICGGRWILGNVAGRKCHWQFTNDVLLVDDVPVFPHQGEIVLMADAEQLSPINGDPKILDRMGQLLKNCDRVILACKPERRAAWVNMLKGIDVDVEVRAPELDQLGALSLRRTSAGATLLVSCGPLALRDRVMKRLLDLSIAVPALVAALPVILILAAAVKLTSPGPVLFAQDRVGQGNRIFRLYKFRSMRAERSDADGARSAGRVDDRITPLGNFLRSTSLDELPQLFNVLLGDMSIVGPRPHALASTAEDMLFWHIDPRYWERHAIKPGITGLA